jgi:hypothetical protein
MSFEREGHWRERALERVSPASWLFCGRDDKRSIYVVYDSRRVVTIEFKEILIKSKFVIPAKAGIHENQ